MTKRPEPSEYADFYAGYVSQVPDGDVVDLLATEIDQTTQLLQGLSPEKGDHRYAPDKWSIKELVGHMIDAERAFGFRALCFARSDPAKLPGFEQDDYVKASNAGRRPLTELVDELRAARHANVAFFRGLDEEDWSRRGTASDCEFSVKGLAYITLGHELHHRRVLKERYLDGA